MPLPGNYPWKEGLYSCSKYLLRTQVISLPTNSIIVTQSATIIIWNNLPLNTSLPSYSHQIDNVKLRLCPVRVKTFVLLNLIKLFAITTNQYSGFRNLRVNYIYSLNFFFDFNLLVLFEMLNRAYKYNFPGHVAFVISHFVFQIISNTKNYIYFFVSLIS